MVGNKLIFVFKKKTTKQQQQQKNQTMLPIVSVSQGGSSPTLVHFLANNVLSICMF